MTIWHMRIACWITKTTDTHSEHVILITFALQQWLHKVPQCYVTVHCLLCYVLIMLMLTTLLATIILQFAVFLINN